MENIRNGRIEYIDAMRGFTMLLVIYSHVCKLIFYTDSVSNDIFILFRMPLFFFISGLMSYAIYSNQLIKKRLANRIKCQLLPTLVCFCLYNVICSIPLKSAIFDNLKTGYWFTFVMVELFLLYIAFVYIINKYNISIKTQGLLIILTILVINVLKSVFYRLGLFDTSFSNLFSISMIFTYYPYFLFGVICKMYSDKFNKILHNNYFMFFSILCFVIFLFIDIASRRLFIEGFLGIIIVYRFFEFYKNIFSKRTILGRLFNYIGKHTLEIYLTHYFFIYSLSGIAKYINLEFIQSSWMIELIVFLFISIIILFTCLLTAKIINISPILYSLLYGLKKQ